MFWKTKANDNKTGSAGAAQAAVSETDNTTNVSKLTVTATSALTDSIVPRMTEVDVTVPAISTDHSNNDDTTAWMISFGATMVPFLALCYGHSRGVTGKIVERVCSSPIGPSGLLLLPFISLSMEKSIYDTVQCIQGIDPKIIPNDRGGFPSGGGTALPSFSLLPVQQYNLLKHPTTITFYSFSKPTAASTVSSNTIAPSLQRTATNSA
jgi:hypothetical protein